MPQVVFGGGSASTGGFNMGMWNVGFLLSLLQDVNTTASGNASQVTFTNNFTFGGPTTLVGQGSFSNYNADGPQSGTLTSFTYTTYYFSAGVPVTMTVTGLSISVATLNTWVINDNQAALEAAIFGGVDTFTGTAFNDSIDGYGGGDVINAGAGNDTVNGGEGNDTINGQDGDDYLIGWNGNDTINGGDGNDDLIGWTGADTINGGAGNDLFDTVDAGDVFDGGDGIDSFALSVTGNVTLDLSLIGTSTGVTFANGGTVRNMERFSVGSGSANAVITIRGTLLGQNEATMAGSGDLLVLDFTTAAETYQMYQVASDRYNFIGANGSLTTTGVDRLQIVGLTGDTFYGTFGNQTFTGGAGDDTFYGSYGNDTINGGGGNDTIWGEYDDDTLNGDGGNDTIYGGYGIDALNGGDGDDTLSGDEDVDTFNGGAGADTVTYALASAGFTADLANQGANTAAAAGETYTAIENLIGSTHSDTLRGNAGVNVLQGGFGNDTLEGREGDDILYGGYDSDSLYGGGGADTMYGGYGDDYFFVESLGDVAIDENGGGTDVVYSDVTFTLGEHIEVLSSWNTINAINLYGNVLDNLIVGNAAQNTMDGGEGADTLIGGGGDDLYVIDNISDVIIETADGGSLDTIYTAFDYYQVGANVENVQITGGPGSYIVGNSVNNLLVGNSGADTLEGGGGADTLVGAAGDDFYLIADQDDVIIELNGGGNDTIYTSISFYQMGANVENLVMTGTGGTYATGNGLDNLIVGNAGADTLDGGAGGDFMVGHQGDDFYFIDDLGDRTIESAGEGTDSIYSSISWVTGAHVENLVLQGMANINGGGNELSNFIFGNSGANIITGGGAADTLSGGAGADQFVYNTASEGGDSITDFVSGVDRLSFSAAGFGGGLVDGGPAPLASGSNPSGVGASFLYDTDDGRLYWDADGAGGDAAVLIATLAGAPSLIASDIIIGA